MPGGGSCCVWPRVLYHNTSLTLYSALLLAASLAIAGAEPPSWAKAGAIFFGGAPPPPPPFLSLLA